MDCIVHGVAKSRTGLSDFHFTSLHFRGSLKRSSPEIGNNKRTLLSREERIKKDIEEADLRISSVLKKLQFKKNYKLFFFFFF